jgi:tetratricopeptide (TPR) repeat protein
VIDGRAFGQTTRRRKPAGLAIALLVTAAFLVFARPAALPARVAVSYELGDETVLAETAGVPGGATAGGEAYSGDVRVLLGQFAMSGDARYLRYAEAALGATAEGAPAAEALLLHARIQQAKHEFDGAAATLRRALEKAPNSAEGWLLYADVLRRAGDLPAARKACLRLALAGHADLAGYCAVEVMLVLGEYEAAYELARRQRDISGERGAALRRWSLEVRAEAARASGRAQEAMSLYAEAVAADEAPFATRLAYADLLFAAQRHADVLDLLGGDGARLAAGVRQLAAARALGAEPAPGVEAMFASRFSSRGPVDAEVLLFRDRALYELYCNGDAETALEFALANWERQKGFEDLELVQSAARAAGDESALQRLDAWRASARSVSQ